MTDVTKGLRNLPSCGEKSPNCKIDDNIWQNIWMWLASMYWPLFFYETYNKSSVSGGSICRGTNQVMWEDRKWLQRITERISDVMRKKITADLFSTVCNITLLLLCFYSFSKYKEMLLDYSVSGSVWGGYITC